MTACLRTIAGVDGKVIADTSWRARISVSAIKPAIPDEFATVHRAPIT
jgi:hypothetical protein